MKFEQTLTARLLPLLAACAIATGAVACSDNAGDGDSGANNTPAAEASPTAGVQDPVGIVALGHSGLTGANSDPAKPDEDAFENSWATGVAPTINSIYLRLAAMVPETRGHVHNAARAGAVSNAMADQARRALAAVPAPALVIIQTIENDVRCDGTDDARVVKFGRNVEDALKIITESSPKSKILMINWFGRPSQENVSALVAAHPEAKAFVTGSGECDFFTPDGVFAPAGLARLTAIIEGYEAEQARVCAAVPQCSTDGGVAARFVDRLDNYSDDLIHLNAIGLAELAELLWPVVEALMASP